MTSKTKVNTNAESVEHISSCQPNFLPATLYQLRERNWSLLCETLNSNFLKSLLCTRRQKRELVWCLYQGAAIADFGPLRVCLDIRRGGREGSGCMCVQETHFSSSSPVVPHWVAQGQACGYQSSLLVKAMSWLETRAEEDSVHSANKAMKWLSLKKVQVCVLLSPAATGTRVVG